MRVEAVGEERMEFGRIERLCGEHHELHQRQQLDADQDQD